MGIGVEAMGNLDAPTVTNRDEVFDEHTWNTIKTLAKQNNLPVDSQSIADAETLVLSHHPDGDMGVVRAIEGVYGEWSAERTQAAVMLANLYRTRISPKKRGSLLLRLVSNTVPTDDIVKKDRPSDIQDSYPVSGSHKLARTQSVRQEGQLLNEPTPTVEPNPETDETKQTLPVSAAAKPSIAVRTDILTEPKVAASTDRTHETSPRPETRSLRELRGDIIGAFIDQFGLDPSTAVLLLDHRRLSFTPQQARLIASLRSLFGVNDVKPASDTIFGKFAGAKDLTVGQNKRLAWFSGFRIHKQANGTRVLNAEPPHPVGWIRNAARNSDGPDTAERDLLMGLEKLFEYFSDTFKKNDNKG